MRHRDWLHRTRAGALHPRSGRLRLVDAALKDYEKRPSEVSLRVLRTAMDHWLQTGSGYSSVRNHDGAVRQLDLWIDSQLETFKRPDPKSRPAVVDPMKPQIPPPPLLVPGMAAKKTAPAFKMPAVKTINVAPGPDGRTDVASLAALRARQREDTQWETVSVDGSQTITYKPGESRMVQKPDQSWELETVTVPTPQDFPLNVRLKMRLLGEILQVKAQVNPVPKDGTVVLPATMRSEFRTHIRSAWNIATLVDGGQRFPIDIDIEWVDVGGYELQIANPPPKAVMAATMGPMSKQQHEAARKKESARLMENTINMGEWAWSDRVGILHEFGHMIGNPDEYSVTAFDKLGQSYDASIHNAPSYSTPSIMNNPSEAGRIHARHFEFIRQEYEAWQTRLGHAPQARIVLETNPTVERLRKMARFGGWHLGQAMLD